MLRTSLIGLLLGASLWTSSASAAKQNPPVIEITYQRALALAREQAPALAIAEARVGEAESRVDAASVRSFNPQIRATAGPRLSQGDTTLDWSIGVQQWVELGGQRGDRINAARANTQASQARNEDAQRLVLRDVSLAFVAVLYWGRRVEIAEHNQGIAEAIEAATQRRHELGDVGGYEESVASLFVVRARTNVDRARAALDQAEGGLKALLGIEAGTDLVARGDLRQLGMPASEMPGSSAPINIDDRPDLQALDADIRAAQAERDLGRAGRVPNLALGVRYARERSADIILGSLALTLPVFDRGQGTVAIADARHERTSAELRAARSTATIEVDTAKATAQRLSEAARRFEDDGLEILERAEQLTTASYEAGAIPLGELLAVRRELVQAELDYAALLHEAAAARIQLTASTGAFQ